ncbi:MAG: phosphoenolpyruvate synthase [Anaerolineaceae bacterium]|nr:phosphoenolpyruvate synthase [Anaerolineaceae bacterium]
MTSEIILSFEQISLKDILRVGGKGANLGEMFRAGFPIPGGFCITTEAFAAFIDATGASGEIYSVLEMLSADDVEGVRKTGAEVRDRLLKTVMPGYIEKSIVSAWQVLGIEHAYSVRSSATAEDLPEASFAGQQDTFLVCERKTLLESVKACWASLFTDRAIVYRVKNGFSHRDVQLSVVIQRMVMSELSGILFTADPVSGHRKMIAINAGYGLGEALVSGIMTPDLYIVDKRDMEIMDRQIAEKNIAIRPREGGGTFREDVRSKMRNEQALDDEQILALAEIGSRIEGHYHFPQDIEWSVEDGKIHILQSRPITSLFPLPEPFPTDDYLHAYVSLSHAQVMTDPISPMGISLWQVLFPFGKYGMSTDYNHNLKEAAGRMYIDISPLMHHAIPHRVLPGILSIADALISQGIREVIDREEFKRGSKDPKTRASISSLVHWFGPMLLKAQLRLWFLPPENAIDYVQKKSDAFLNSMTSSLEAVPQVAERLRIACDHIGRVFEDVAAMFLPLIASLGMSLAILPHISKGENSENDIKTLQRGLSGNITTDMDLFIGDLADIIRRSKSLKELFSTQKFAEALLEAADYPDGEELLSALEHFMDLYGMRGPSELDIARPRFREDPTFIFQVVTGNLGTEQANQHREKHARLAVEGEAAAKRLIAAARQGKLGFIRAIIARRVTRAVRHYAAVREHPKYLLICAVGIMKQLLLEAAHLMLERGIIDEVSDIWYLKIHEAINVLESPQKELRSTIARRRTEMERFAGMKPPRVMTSDGEIPVIKYSRQDLPEGALAGVSVSAGVIEGIARVVMDPQKQILYPGEILVAPFTDPGWTPLFLNAAGLVMEVGGMMTHGSVIAREYGLPAVVSVLDATTQIQTGQRIRVNGDQGFVEILGDDDGQKSKDAAN